MPATRFAIIPLRDLALVVVMFLMLSASVLGQAVNCTVGAADASPSDDAGTLHRCASAGGALVVASAATPVVVPAGLSAEDD